MDPLPVRAFGNPIKMGFQKASVGGRSGNVGSSPRRKQCQRIVDQLSFVCSRRARAQRVVRVDHDARALKTGLKLEAQPTFDATDVMMVEDLGGQLGDVARLIPVEEATQ